MSIPGQGGQQDEPPVEVDAVLVAQHVDDLARTVADQGATIGEMVSILEELTEAPQPRPSPYSWVHAEDEHRSRLWGALEQWVTWHNHRYGDTNLRIEACWYQHPVVVEHLTALMEAWRAAYTGHTKARFDAVSYIHHYLIPMIERIRQEQWGFRNCSTARHELNLGAGGAGRGVPDPERADAFAAHVEADVATHVKQAAPIEPKAATERPSGPSPDPDEEPPPEF